MNASSFTLQKMKRGDLNIAIQWAKEEGWNPGIYDADCFYSVDPNGFFIGMIDDTPISTISAVSYDENFGFIGLYIVKPEFRGKEYGLKTWQKAIGYLGTKNIGLDGVIAQQENYKKSGFTLAYRNIRFGGKSKKYSVGDIPIINASDVSFEKLCEYDRLCFPAAREKFLHRWINQPESHALCVQEQANKLKGYGVIRKCQKGYKIGPLFADNKKIAQRLFEALNNRIKQGSVLYLDTPEVNLSAVDLARKNGMNCVFETARMYTKEQPEIAIDKMFGVTTFELG